MAGLSISKKGIPGVWREGLWMKMTKLGLGGKFLRICQEIYSKTSARVRVGSTKSRSYQVTTGLREGCALSPILFSIFIMDLAEKLKRKGLGVEIKGHWIGHASLQMISFWSQKRARNCRKC